MAVNCINRNIFTLTQDIFLFDYAYDFLEGNNIFENVENIRDFFNILRKMQHCFYNLMSTYFPCFGVKRLQSTLLDDSTHITAHENQVSNNTIIL